MTIILAAVFLIAGARIETPKPKVTPPPPQCDESLWKHIFPGDPRQFKKPEDRLRVIDRCKTVTGTIVWMKGEGDGDIHIRLLLDTQFKNLLNAKNRKKLPKGQGGHLVVEPICQKEPTEGSAVKQKPCVNFRQSLPSLAQIRANIRKKKGTRVEVTGAFVTDAEHGWNEIHPVTTLKLIP